MISKLPNTGTTIFSVMTALANEVGAVNLSQGFPDFDPPERLLSLVNRALQGGQNQYAPMPGVPALRTVVSAKYQHLLQCAVDPDVEVTITSGGTSALFTVIAATVHPGDEVLIFEPAYDSYAPAVELMGGTVIRSPLTLPLYQPDWDHVQSIITDRTRLIIINSPHNPSGSMWQSTDLQILAYICQQRDCLVLADEVYDLITFQRPHQSVLSIPELRERAFVVMSFGKLVHATGWKIGACIAVPELTNEFRKAHQYLTFSANTPVQHGLAEYLQDMEAFQTLAPFMSNKRKLFVDGVEHSHWIVRPCEGTYFQLLDYSQFWRGTDIELANRLARDFKVACIPLSPFSESRQQDKAVRLCFAKQDHVLTLAAERLCTAAEHLAQE